MASPLQAALMDILQIWQLLLHSPPNDYGSDYFTWYKYFIRDSIGRFLLTSICDGQWDSRDGTLVPRNDTVLLGFAHKHHADNQRWSGDWENGQDNWDKDRAVAISVCHFLRSRLIWSCWASLPLASLLSHHHGLVPRVRPLFPPLCHQATRWICMCVLCPLRNKAWSRVGPRVLFHSVRSFL